LGRFLLGRALGWRAGWAARVDTTLAGPLAAGSRLLFFSFSFYLFFLAL
jgi:hypothetical protein